MKQIIRKTNSALWHRIVFKGGQQLVALIFGIFLARILSPREFGIVAMANIVVHYANNFTNFGLNNALVQKDNVKEEHINTVFTIDFLISFFLVLVTVWFADDIAVFFHKPDVGPVLRWMSLYYIITTFYYIPIVLLRRGIDFRFMTVVEFMEAVLTSLAAVFLALAGFSYWSIVVPTLVVPCLITVILMVKTRWRPRFTIGRDMSDLYSFGLWNFIRAQVQLLVAKVDYFVIGRYLDVSSLGIYEKSFELTERAMSGLTMPVNGIFFSTFSRLQDDIAAVRGVFLQASTILTFICYPVLLGLAAVAPHFVHSCLGPQWSEAVLPIRILAVGSLFRVLLGMVANVNVTVGYYKIHTFYNIIAAVLFVGLCFWLVSYGIAAVCIGYFIYCLFSFLAGFVIISHAVNLGIDEFIKALWCPVAGSLIMFLAVYLLSVNVFTDTGSFFDLILLIIAGGLVYAAWCYPFYRMGLLNLSVRQVQQKV